MSYLGPDNMELSVEQRGPGPFVITPGIPNNLRMALLAKIKGGDVVQVGKAGTSGWDERMEVYDTDGEGGVLWNDATADDEIGARLFDLDLALETGLRVRVSPR